MESSCEHRFHKMWESSWLSEQLLYPIVNIVQTTDNEVVKMHCHSRLPLKKGMTEYTHKGIISSD
jgi:hypothetical protein